MKKIIVVILIIIVVVNYFYVYSLAESSFQINYSEDIRELIEKETIDEEVKDRISEFNHYSSMAEKLMNLFDSRIGTIDSEKFFYNKDKDLLYRRIISNNIEYDFSIEGNLIEYKDYNLYSFEDKNKRMYEDVELIDECLKIETEDDLSFLIDSVFEIEKLIDYKIIDVSNHVKDKWIITICKKETEELINSFDNVNIVVDAITGKVMLYSRNMYNAEYTIPKIMKEEVEEILNDNLEEAFSLKDYKLNYIRDYNGDKEIHLVWMAFSNEGNIFYVDAIDGYFMGIDTFRSTDCARAISSPYVGNAAYLTLKAYNALDYLGYDQTNYSAIYGITNQSTINWTLSQSDIYGLYLAGHGYASSSVNEISDTEDNNYNWTILSNTNYGNWHFVFLDACYSSSNSNWVNAFHADGSGRCFVGWNNEVLDSTVLYFDNKFFNRLGTMSVGNAVVTTLWEARNAGYDDPDSNICDPGFDGDGSYWGWAW